MNKCIILQGPVPSRFDEVVDAIRSWFSGRVILSTWEGEGDVKEDVETVYLPDPGPGPVQNFKRQLVGLNEALKLISDGLVFKTRSDMVHPVDMFQFFKDEPCQMFKSKVVISNMMTRKPHIFPYFISDWFYVGRREDLVDYSDLDYLYTLEGCEPSWVCSYLRKKRLSLTGEQVLDNFKVINTRTTAQAFNFNYENQPQNHPYYVTEEMLYGN